MQSYLGFCAFSATIESFQNKPDHTDYVIKVSASPHYSIPGHSWLLCKRFSDFDKLNQRLRVYNPNLPLPPKKIFGSKAREFVIERQAGLQRYLDSILTDPLLCHSAPVVDFLYGPFSSLLSDFQSRALQFVSMEFRSGLNWEIIEALPEFGYRVCKTYFLVKKCDTSSNGYEEDVNLEASNKYCATWHEYLRLPTPDGKELTKTVASLLTLRHPFILPVEHAVCNERGILFIRPFSRLGSLADGIYQVKPVQVCLKKYSKQPTTASSQTGLTMQAVRAFGRQILEALTFLHSRGYYYGHLTTRNVILTTPSTVALSDVENNLFNYHGMVRPHLVALKKQWTLEEVDSYCFGRCLLEMASGKPVEKPCLDPEDLPKSHELRAILQILLVKESIRNKLPSAESLLKHEFFSTVKVPSLGKPVWKITSSCRQLMNARQEQIKSELLRDQQLLKASLWRSQTEDRLAEEKYHRQLEYRRHTTLGDVVSPPMAGTTSNSHKAAMQRSESFISTSSALVAPLRDKHKVSNEDVAAHPLTPTIRKTTTTSTAKPSAVHQTTATTNQPAFLGCVTNFNKGALKKVVTNDRSAPSF